MVCGCTAAEHGRHRQWTCTTCGAFAAEGCVDVTRWGSATIPAGLPTHLRWAVVFVD